MSIRHSRRWSVFAGASLLAASGCATVSDPLPEPPAARSAHQPRAEPPAIQPVSHAEPAAAPSAPAATPFDKLDRVTAADIVRQVLARNPTLTQMAAAVQAAAARYPQVTSYDDPMLTAWMAPGTIDAKPPAFFYSQRVELAQKVPYPGKLALRGASAQAQAVAADKDLDETRLELVEAARSALADYYLAERGLEVNAEGLRLLREFRQNAESRYKTGQTPQQDILQADVEIGQQDERRLAWDRARTVAIARLNTLMNLPVDTPIPSPASPNEAASLPENAKPLRELALSRRPDLQALAARIVADRAALGLAGREYYPDFEFMAAYDSFWNMTQQQGQIGVKLNLPVQMNRRAGAVAEAQARLVQRQAELARQTNQVAFEVERALARVRESEKAVRLYQERILPAARENVKSAQPAYVTGKIPFLTLVETERSLVRLLDRYYDALAETMRRRAALERAIGGPIAPVPTKDTPSGSAPPKPLPDLKRPTSPNDGTRGAAAPRVPSQSGPTS
jgi:outer membrane protein TolC